jgi:competence protein ComEC
MRATLFSMTLLCSMLTLPLRAQTDDTLRVRIADVGAGLCTVTRAPGGEVMVHDAGHWLGQGCLAAVRPLVPGDTIDLLVLSHADSDHLGDATEILGEYTVRLILWTGYRRPGVVTWDRTNDAIAEAVRTNGTSVRSLTTHPLIPAETMPLGEATITPIAGWGGWEGGTGLSEPERRNAVSIVLRVDYRGGSVLYPGDTVGRRIGDPANACKDAESAMVANHDAGSAPMSSFVLIAPHHGADNASSACFIRAVDPHWVIFAAGHAHEHPRSTSAQRYLAHGVAEENLLRTDRGDDEAGMEWAGGRVSGCQDGRDDDDIEIMLLPNGLARVEYVRETNGC